MVDNKAIIKIIDALTEQNGAPCKKTIQKIVFLIQSKHVDLGCDYGIHFYGPYSSDLDYTIRALSDDGILNIEYTPTEHRISVASKTFVEPYNNATVNSVISEYSKDTPSELELLATSLYVYLGVKDVSKIKDGVIKIKGQKYSEEHILSAIERLKNTGFIN